MKKNKNSPPIPHPRFGSSIPLFQDYSDYVMDFKEKENCSEATLKKYSTMLVQVNDAIGNIQLDNVRPEDLNTLYQRLAKRGERSTIGKAVALPALLELQKTQHLSGGEIARRSGVAASTVSAMLNGKTVETRKARMVAHSLGKTLPELFDVTYSYRKLTPKTILEYHRMIYMILRYAENEKLVAENAAKNAYPPVDKEKPLQYLDDEQVKKLLLTLESAPLKWKAAVRIMLDTGCTRGELIPLTNGSVDLAGNTIWIQRDTYRASDDTLKIRQLPMERMRKSAISEQTKALLEQLGAGNGNSDSYVFAQDNGNWMHPDSLTKWLTKFSKTNGLPHLNPEFLRSTAAVLKIKESGSRAAAFRILQEQMGYSTEVYIEKRYSDVLDELPD